MAERAWSPWGVDSRTPTDTRVYDYAMGGKDNYAVDRRFAARLIAAAPEARFLAGENTGFTRRAMRVLRERGIRQFIDVGCGLPKAVNVHDLAGPGARVVYVDYDPVAVVHFEAELSGSPGTAIVHADVRNPADILAAPGVADLIDPRRPVGLLMTHMLHLIGDEDRPARIVRHLLGALAPGSHLVVAHVSHEGRPEPAVRAIREVSAALREPVVLRGRAEIASFFDGLDLLEPGIVPARKWRPDGPCSMPSGWLLAGVGRKP